MTVSAPATAITGATGTINLAFSGLTAGTKYLGSVAYGGAAGMPNPTIVRVEPVRVDQHFSRLTTGRPGEQSPGRFLLQAVATGLHLRPIGHRVTGRACPPAPGHSTSRPSRLAW